MTRVSFSLSIFFSLAFFDSSVQAADYDCRDFGTQERAQFEFDQHKYITNEKGWTIEDNFDRYGLDRDSDGSACDLNPSSKSGMLWMSGLGILGGIFLAKSERDGAFLPKNLFNEDILYVLVLFWWVPYFVMAVARSRLLSASTSPMTLYFLTLIVGVVLSYCLAIIGLKRKWF